VGKLKGASLNPDDFTSEPLEEPVPKQDAQTGKSSTTAPPKVRDFPLILSPSAPLDSAYRFINDCCTKRGLRTLHFYQGEFFRYEKTHYQPIDTQGIRTELYNFLKQAKISDGKGGYQPFEPNRKKIGDVLDALKAASFIASEAHLPVWLNRSTISPGEILVCRNGILHIPSLKVLKHTPAFFSLKCLPFDFDPEAGPPVRWLRFLKELWPNDPFSVSALGEWFGYCLSADTRQQKILLIVGPMRSGKGTIARIQTKVLGARAVCSPSLADLSQLFGLQPLIGKGLAVVSDVRLGKADQSAMIERLLSISGEDVLTIHRKNKTAWIGTLPTKIMILSNELPLLRDQSSAATSRLLVLKLTKSFLGQEDTTLTDRLSEELPALLNWSLDGLDRLQRRGHFRQPNSAKGAIKQLEELGSPISQFLEDQCKLGPEFSIPTDRLFKAWKMWSDSQGIQPGSMSVFGRALSSFAPSVEKKRPRKAGRKSRYMGIKLA